MGVAFGLCSASTLPPPTCLTGEKHLLNPWDPNEEMYKNGRLKLWVRTLYERDNYPGADPSNATFQGDVSLGRYNRNARIRVQKAENVNLALEFVTSRGVKLTNIGPEDIIDRNLELILGFFGNVQTKHKTYGMREWTPPSGLTVSRRVPVLIMSSIWIKHGSNFCGKAIKAQTREIREARRKRFAALANAFEQRLRVLSQEISAMAGPLEVPFLSSRVLYPDILSTAQDEQQQMSHIQSKLPVLSGALTDVFKVEIACETTNVDENDHTVLTHQEHAFGLDLVVQSVIKKIKSIENQNVSGYMTKLTPGRHIQIFRQGWQQYS
ncbi:hypothetical protein SISNIDRAFT_465816 [Sistotremastrum niveocremeum HHB9708]|uniref:Uncharacterized protein n=1 Tax=Sistotremastrum niveocremeum HHB9708 TaxID=1314777 RepID=A0A164UXU9_9AGAM|nr:hypothetical protein SISNIDRAFT_465816 [Sistotremastrum niveocremeum HHB9708]